MKPSLASDRHWFGCTVPDYLKLLKSSQILSKEQLLGNEDAVEEDAFKGDISCLASNEANIIPEEADAMHWSFSNNFNDMVHCAVESNEYAEQKNISLASASTPEVNDDCAAVSPYGLAFFFLWNNGT
ncbi:unnamed protein product [Camellia sinensis]